MRWSKSIPRVKSMSRAFMVLCCGFLVFGCTDKRSDQYQMQGDMYYRLQKHALAEESYQNAVKSNPDNVLAKVSLGRVKAVLNKPDEALKLFNEATSLEPEFPLAHLEIVQLLMRSGQVEDALAETSKFESINPELGGVLRASLLVNSGQQSEAQTLLMSLREQFPDSIIVRSHSASVLLGTGSARKAKSELEMVLQDQNSSSIGANVLLVDALLQLGEIDAKIEELQGQGDDDPDRKLILAYALLRTGNETDGEAILQGVLNDDIASPSANLVYGAYMTRSEKPELADRYLRIASLELPWDATVMHRISQGKSRMTSTPKSPTMSRPDVSKAVTSSGQETDWKKLWRYASLHQLIQNRDAFEGQEGDTLKETLVLSALFLENTKLAQELAKDLEPDSPVNGYLTALLEGKRTSAIEALKPWLEQDEAHQILAMNAMGFATAVAGNKNLSIQILSNGLQQFPDNGVGLFLVAKVYNSAKMHRFAAQAMRGMTTRFPDSLHSHLMVVRAYQLAEMDSEARQSAQVMYALFPDSPEAALVTSRTYLQDKYLEESGNILSYYLEKNPDDSEIRLALAAVLFRQGLVDESLSALESNEIPDSMGPGYMTLNVLCQLAQSNWQAVIELAESVERSTMSLSTRFALAAAYTGSGQNEKAALLLKDKDTYEALGGSVGNVLLGALKESSEQLSTNQATLANALASNDSSLVSFASGTAYQLAKFYSSAYTAFNQCASTLSVDSDLLMTLQFRNLANARNIDDVDGEAMALADTYAENPKAWMECAAIAQSSNNKSIEKLALDRALALSDADAKLFLARGNYFSRLRDYTSALAEYRSALKIEPSNPTINNNIAYYTLLSDGDVKEALAAAELAAGGLKYNPNMLHTLGVAQMRSGDLENAEENLRYALTSLPGDPSILLDYGELLIAQGDLDGGRRHVENSLQMARIMGIDFERKWEAEAVLGGME